VPVQSQVSQHEVADPDSALVGFWLANRPPHTARAYAADLRRFREFIVGPLECAEALQIEAFASSLESLAPATRTRILSTVRSFLRDAREIGYVSSNLDSAIVVIASPRQGAKRLVRRSELERMLKLEGHLRNRALLSVLFEAGPRVTDLVKLRWDDLDVSAEQAILNIGSGNRSRARVLTPETAQMLGALRKDAAGDRPMFVSRRGGALDPSQVLRIVRSAAARAGLTGEITPRVLRRTSKQPDSVGA
jgi:integrase